MNFIQTPFIVPLLWRKFVTCASSFQQVCNLLFTKVYIGSNFTSSEINSTLQDYSQNLIKPDSCEYSQ